MVSVIIPTYKRASFIKRAIDSVLNQTYKDIEVIIVDDNNPGDVDRKELEQIVAEYSDDRLIYLQHEMNKNGAAARNTGISVARGEYITFLDDDDFFLDDRVEKAIAVMEKEKEYDCLYTGVIKVKNNRIVDVRFSHLEGNLQKNMLVQKSFFYTGSNLFFRAKALKSINGFDTSFSRYQDIEVMVRFFRRYKIKSIMDFSVVKDDSSRINALNVEKNIMMKKHFLRVFSQDINKYEDRNEIYLAVYTSLINSIPKKNPNFKKILNESKKYGKVKINNLRWMKNREFYLKKIYKLIKGKMKLMKYINPETRKKVIRYLDDYKIEI